MSYMKILFIFSVALTLVNPSSAVEKQLNAKQVKKKYGIVEGKYKLAPGSNENCMSGDMEIFEGNNGILSIKMGDGLLAKHLDVSSFKDFEKDCTLVIRNSKSKSGLENEEIMVCVNPQNSYSRTFKAEFPKNKFNYELRFKRSKNSGKVTTACYLNKIK